MPSDFSESPQTQNANSDVIDLAAAKLAPLMGLLKKVYEVEVKMQSLTVAEALELIDAPTDDERKAHLQFAVDAGLLEQMKGAGFTSPEFVTPGPSFDHLMES